MGFWLRQGYCALPAPDSHSAIQFAGSLYSFISVEFLTETVSRGSQYLDAQMKVGHSLQNVVFAITACADYAPQKLARYSRICETDY